VFFNEIISHYYYHSKQMNTIWDNSKSITVISDGTHIHAAL